MFGYGFSASGMFVDGFLLTNVILLPITILLWKIWGELRQLNGKQPIALAKGLGQVVGQFPQQPPVPPQSQQPPVPPRY